MYLINVSYKTNNDTVMAYNRKCLGSISNKFKQMIAQHYSSFKNNSPSNSTVITKYI